MSSRRLSVLSTVPPSIKKIFNDATEPVSSEERLWRERAARMTLDALGHTNLTMKPARHNEAVRYARRWFRGIFDDNLDPKLGDDSTATFDAGNLIGFRQVREAVLAIAPRVLDERNDDIG